MAVMTYTEPNDKKWLGIRPGHKGTQVLSFIEVPAGGSDLLYTVPGGKTLYLCNVMSYPITAVSGYWDIRLFDEEETVLLYIPGGRTYTTEVANGVSVCFPTPIEVPGNSWLELYCSGTVGVKASLFGWIQ